RRVARHPDALGRAQAGPAGVSATGDGMAPVRPRQGPDEPTPARRVVAPWRGAGGHRALGGGERLRAGSSGEGQRLTVDHGAERTAIGACLREPEREWLYSVLQRWLSPDLRRVQ